MENIFNLEREYANFVGTQYAVAVNSGTSALHLSLVALGVGIGDEVIVPDFSMAAVGFSVAYTGARVVTVDCGDDLNIDPNLIYEKITNKTKAIIVVHTYGRRCDMQRINEIAQQKLLPIIEDGCEAQGVTKGGEAICSVFSFYKNKIIHAEEGGIVCTNSEEVATNVRDLKNMCFGKSHDYFHTRIGYNYRIPDSQAKMALDSLHEYPVNYAKRRGFESQWNKLMSTPKRDTMWVYDFLCSSAMEKENKIKDLDDKKIPWRHFFKPLSSMPMFLQDIGRNALDYSNRGLYIQYHE